MDWKKIYESKRMSLRAAAALIDSGDTLWAGSYCSNPVQLLDALADRRDELKGVRIVTALQCAPHRYLAGTFRGHIEAHTIFCGMWDRKFYSEGNVHINSVPYSQSGYALRDIWKVNTLFVEVSEPDEDGYLYYGPLGVAWNGRVASYAQKKIVQVNRFQGRARGKNNRIHVSEVDAICQYDHPLPEMQQPAVCETDRKIASYIVPRISDGATLQIGLGGIANAVAYGLEGKKRLGIHTEMMTDSLVYLAKKGAIDPDNVRAGFGMGSQQVYDYCTSGIPEMMDICEINDPYFAGSHDNFVSINSCLMADLTGQIASESIGFRQFSCTGGQLDYVTAAQISRGGQSYLCLKSTHPGPDGRPQSSITAALPAGQAITTPRSAVMSVVTEWGCADLRNRPLDERVHAMIAIAHPDFRKQLEEDARKYGLLF